MKREKATSKSRNRKRKQTQNPHICKQNPRNPLKNPISHIQKSNKPGRCFWIRMKRYKRRKQDIPKWDKMKEKKCIPWNSRENRSLIKLATITSCHEWTTELWRRDQKERRNKRETKRRRRDLKQKTVIVVNMKSH